MTEIIFCRTDYKYDSYIDYWRLVELSGFTIMPLGQLNLARPGVYIISPHNGQYEDVVGSQMNGVRNAHVIHWDLERPSAPDIAGAVGKYGERQRSLMYNRWFDEVWVSDRRLALETSLRYVTLGSHPNLGEPGEYKTWDFTHQSYEGPPRRQTIYNQFVSSRIGPNCWPPKRDEVLSKSKFGAALHQDGFPFLEPLRLAIFAAYGLPTICETVMDAYPYCNQTLVFASYDDFADKLRHMIASDYRDWKKVGQRMRERMTVEFEFGKVVREAVEQSVGDWR